MMGYNQKVTFWFSVKKKEEKKNGDFKPKIMNTESLFGELYNDCHRSYHSKL